MEDKDHKKGFWNYVAFYTVIGICTLTIIWLHYYPWKIFHNNNLLELNGIETTAKLVKRQYSGGSKGGDIHRLILEYIPSKAINKEKKIIDMEVHPTVYGLVGIDKNRIPILYLADDPDIIKLKNVEPELRPLIECIIIDLILLGLGLYGLFDHFRKKRNPPQIE